MSLGIDITLMNTSGSVVDDLGAGRYRIETLEFSTVVPGGFGEARVVVLGAPARLWAIRPGLTLRVRRRGEVLYWGWIEDVRRTVRGVVEGLEIIALGPYQQLAQRIWSGSYTNVESTAILQEVLRANCPDISPDHSNIAPSGVSASLSFSNRTVADLVREVCALGNSSEQALMFAVWEPSYNRANLGPTANLLSDPMLEQGTAYWELNGGADYQTSIYRSPTHGVRYDSTETGEVRYKGRTTVIGGQPYAVSYWAYFSAYAGMEVYTRLDWFTAADTMIGSNYSTHHTSSGAAGWTQWIDIHNAPSNAATARPFVYAGVGSGSGRIIVLDDIMMYLAAATTPIDHRPRPHLWAIDTGGYDYILDLSRTAGMRETTTTRDLANYIVARYGSGSYTSAAQDSNSQARYRRRDAIVSTAATGSAEAEAARDTALILRAQPKRDADQVTVEYGSLFTRLGALAHPDRLRAGQRVKLLSADTSSVVWLRETRWRDGVVTITPERFEDLRVLLAS